MSRERGKGPERGLRRGASSAGPDFVPREMSSSHVVRRAHQKLAYLELVLLHLGHGLRGEQPDQSIRVRPPLRIGL
jgi:hypothetical protein